MSECADCGGPVEDFATYCEDCRGTTRPHGSGPSGVADRGAAQDDASTDTSGTHPSRSTARTDAAATHVGAFLAVAAAVGAYGVLQTLLYLPDLIRYSGGLGPFAPVVAELVHVPLVLAYGVMAKRLFDGTADKDRYARYLTALAALTVASAIGHELALAFPVVHQPIGRLSLILLPYGVDPGYITLNFPLNRSIRTFVPPSDVHNALVVVGTGATALAAHHLRPKQR
jgi:hypothetical protein